MEQLELGHLLSPGEKAYTLIKHFESCFLKSYQGKADRKGVYTIGWGTIMYPDGKRVQLGETITQEKADSLLQWEVETKAKALRGLLRNMKLRQSQFDALISFAYNLGVGALEKSTLLRKMRLNPNDSTIAGYSLINGMGRPASCEFLKWVYSNSKEQKGLIRRRTAEAHLYNTGVVKFFTT